METFLIAGLGNPGLRYKDTRHNTGYRAIERLSERIGADFTDKHFHALNAKGVMDGKKLILMKPLTYMNLSGDALRAASDYLGIDPDHIIVLSDDTALDIGRIRIRKGGSAGGHNGLKDIIDKLGTDRFSRIRIGIGKKTEEMDLKDFVLSRFLEDEIPLMEQACSVAADAALLLLSDGIDTCMSKYNGLDLKNIDV